MAGRLVQVRENGRIGCQARIVKLRVLDPEDPSKELAAIRAKVGRRKADARWHGKHKRQANWPHSVSQRSPDLDSMLQSLVAHSRRGRDNSSCHAPALCSAAGDLTTRSLNCSSIAPLLPCPQPQRVLCNAASLEAENLELLHCEQQDIVRVDVPIRPVNLDASAGVRKGGWIMILK